MVTDAPGGRYRAIGWDAGWGIVWGIGWGVGAFACSTPITPTTAAKQRHDQPESELELAGQGVHPRLHPLEAGVHLCTHAVEPGIELAPHCDVLTELRAERARQPLGLPLFHSRPPQRVGHLQCVYHRLAQSPCSSVRIAILALWGIRSRTGGL